jgi:hypothetical protein
MFSCNLPSIESGLQPGLEEATEVTVIYNRGQKGNEGHCNFLNTSYNEHFSEVRLYSTGVTGSW